MSKDIKFDFIFHNALAGLQKAVVCPLLENLPGCLTCGETIEAAVSNAIDAKRAWLQAAIEEKIEIHEPDSLADYSGQFKIRMPRSLHRSLAEHSKREGISMNQYCVYLLSKNDAAH